MNDEKSESALEKIKDALNNAVGLPPGKFPDGKNKAYRRQRYAPGNADLRGHGRGSQSARDGHRPYRLIRLALVLKPPRKFI